MSFPDHLHSPLQVIAPSILAAFNPNASSIERAKACAEIAHLDPAFLRRLAEDDAWVFLTKELRGEDTEDALEPWQQGSDAAPAHVEPSVVQHRLEMHPTLFKRLSGASHDPKPAVIRDPYQRPTRFDERMACALAADSRPHEDLAEYARAWAFSVVDPAHCLFLQPTAFPDREDIAVAIVDVCLRHRGPGPLLPALEPEFRKAIAASPSARSWIEETVSWIDERVAETRFEGAEAASIYEAYLALRMGIAERAVRAEIMKPEVLRVVDIYAASQVLWETGRQDVVSAWRQSGEDERRVAIVHKHRVHSCTASFDQVFFLLQREPTAEWWRRRSPGEIEALRRVTRFVKAAAST